MTASLTFSPADVDVATRTVYGEARGEGRDGWIAVAWVIRNRAEHPGWWGRTPAGVCVAHAQFSCWLTSDPNRVKLISLAPADPTYQRIAEVVSGVLDGTIPDPTGGADHYEVVGTGATWARGRAPSATIGHHAFYALGIAA